jgi:hypothetical protein
MTRRPVSEARLCIGAISGTSMDAIDVALIETDGEVIEIKTKDNKEKVIKVLSDSKMDGKNNEMEYKNVSNKRKKDFTFFYLELRYLDLWLKYRLRQLFL